MKLHDYQLVARDYIRERKRAALFLDMGLGKTATVLSALEPEHLPALVTAPKKVAENTWGTERDLWRPDLSISVAMGDPSARSAALAAGADITVIGRDNLRDVLSGRSNSRRQYKTLVIDELSGYKTRSSVRWKTARKLTDRPEVENVWGLTGTPAPNGLLDLWAQIYLLDRGKRLGTRLTDYRSRYFFPGGQLPSGVITHWVPRDETPDNVERLLEDICLYMSADGRLDLPPVTHNKIHVQLPPKVKQLYNEMKSELAVEIKDVFGENAWFTAANEAVLSGKLAQISAGFVYVDEAEYNDYRYTRLHSAKVDALMDIVEFATSPVLVFYRFKAELEMMREKLPQSHTIDERDIVRRWNRGDVPVLFAHPASAGHGLNLQHGGHTAVWTSLPESLEEWQQANKRLHRQGQKSPVVIHVIMSDGSVDSRIYNSLEDKDAVQQRLLDYLESPL